MKKAKPTLRNVLMGAEPYVADSVQEELCWLCQRPLDDGAASLSFFAGELPDRWSIVHDRCAIERAMFVRAFSRA